MKAFFKENGIVILILSLIIFPIPVALFVSHLMRKLFELYF